VESIVKTSSKHQGKFKLGRHQRCIPEMAPESCETGVVVYLVIPALRRLEQKDHEFKPK
jgi:hypothetical protein